MFGGKFKRLSLTLLGKSPETSSTSITGSNSTPNSANPNATSTPTTTLTPNAKNASSTSTTAPGPAAAANKKRPPPPKPDVANSWRVDTELLKKTVPNEFTRDQLMLFTHLMTALTGTTESVPEDITLMNIGIASGLFENYLAEKSEKDGKNEKKDKNLEANLTDIAEKKAKAEKVLQKYNWVFYTDNDLGTRLREILLNLQETNFIKKEGDSYYLVSSATL